MLLVRLAPTRSSILSDPVSDSLVARTPTISSISRLCLVSMNRHDENPHCRYESSRLHFAIHVRMGDRHRFADEHPDYVKRLEEVMSTISQEVTRKGLPEPLFHIFSETVDSCPSEKTGVFGEFPAWPVTSDQVAVYLFFGADFISWRASNRLL